MLYLLWKKIQQQPFIGSVVVILKSSVMVQVLCFALSPVLTRLYLPTDFGIFTVYLSLLSIFAIIVALRFDIAIPVPKRDIDAAYLTITSIISTFVNALLCLLLVTMFRHQISTSVALPVLADYLWILPAGLCMAGIYNTCNYWLVRQCQFDTIAHAKIVQGVAMVLAQILGGLMHLRPMGLLLGILFGQLIGVILILLHSGDRLLWGFRHFSTHLLVKIVRKYWKFPFLSSPASLINALGLYLPAIVIGAVYGAKIAGWFGLVIQVIAAPLALIGQAVGQVYIGQGAKLKQDGQMIELRKLYLRAMMVCFTIAMPFILVLVMMGPTLFSFIFGQNWIQSGCYAQVLAFMLLIEFTVVGPSQNFTLLERQDLSLLWNLLFCSLIGIAFLPALINHTTISATLLYLCIAKSVGYITMAGLNIYILSGSETMSVRCAE